MAITDKEQGVWGLDQVYNKINQGSIWEYSGANQLNVTGRNNEGQLGLNDTTQRSSPTQVPGTTWNIGVMAENVGMAVRTDGTLWAMGLNSNGEFGGPPLNIAGTGSPGWRSSPIQIPGTWGTDELLIVDHTLFALKSDLTPSQL